MAVLPPADQLFPPISENTNQMSIPVSWFFHPALPAVNSAPVVNYLVDSLEEAEYLQTTSSTTMIAL